jgi:arginine N-succinyltransferase
MSFVTRLAQPRDLDALAALSEHADPRVYTLPRGHDAVRQAIERSLESVTRAVDVPADEHYLLVLEAEGGDLLGTAALRSTAGSQGTFFCFRNDVIHHASHDLKVSSNVHVLALSSDLTGHSQLLSFFVDETRVPRAAAAQLSRGRLALVAAERPRFAQRFFASLAGWCDEALASPFWDALGRRFFGMDFIEAERAVSGARNRTMIVELMPHYPVYVPLLPAAAQAAIGQLHEQATLPYEILAAEGFEADSYVDLFDGGPILEAHASRLRTLSGARTLVAQPLPGGVDATTPVLLARTRALQDFRCVNGLASVHVDDGVVLLPAALLRSLQVEAGERILVSADSV